MCRSEKGTLALIVNLDFSLRPEGNLDNKPALSTLLFRAPSPVSPGYRTNVPVDVYLYELIGRCVDDKITSAKLWYVNSHGRL